MIRVAIIGTGNIANAHMEAYKTLKDHCRVTALVDIIPGKARQFMERHGLQCDVYERHEDMLGRGDIDLADICTPPYTHASISVDCLYAGMNVVCEKPMAASLEECDRMIKARDDSGKLLSIIAQNRFRGPIRDLKELLKSGLAGPVRHVQVESLWWRGHSYYDLWWRGTWQKEGGGCTLNHAVHHVDMLCWMMGLPQSVSSVLANTAHDNAEVEDLSISILRYPGALAQLTASVVDHGEEQQVIFQCEKAKIAAPFSCRASTPQDNGFPVPNPALEEEIAAYARALPPMKYEGHTGQLADVLAAIRHSARPAVTGEDGRRAIELITAIYKSGAENREVKLPIGRSDPFYTVEGIMAGVPRFYEKTASVMEQGGDITLGSSYEKKGEGKA